MLRDQRICWEEIIEIREQFTNHWKEGGDFKAISNKTERTEVGTVCLALGMFFVMGWKDKCFLVIEEVDSRLSLIGFVSFLKADKNGNKMAVALVGAGLKRLGMVKSWCFFSNSGSRGWSYPPHGWLNFNVSRTASDGAMGDGVLKDVEAELGAIVTALDVFIDSGWKGSGSLIIEMGSRVVYNWILEKTRSPWSHQVSFADLDRRIACVGELSFFNC
ncbi:hypothetical protein CXB51_021786 [Gossypium anomalum]|uniref:RNase H type-1 domain-containing protein n=1 Tax=Gossypium anomalum TaxID=47600 RepID=A0A8J5YU73_9ROSI|nr:hypothetical protein CXB51_021786 [Gossypium anomalum]